MNPLYQFLKKRVYTNLIKPVFESVSPIRETALGSAIGMFVGMTPTVGLQMWIVFMIWLGCKYFLNLRFDLIVGTALVWISNPFTMFPLYYGFLATGYYFLTVSGISAHPLDLSYSNFYDQLSAILSSQQSSSLEIMINGTRFLLYDLGYPMLIGSLFFAIPLSILSYILIWHYLPRYRKQKARKMGMNYERWVEIFERKSN